MYPRLQRNDQGGREIADLFRAGIISLNTTDINIKNSRIFILLDWLARDVSRRKHKKPEVVGEMSLAIYKILDHKSRMKDLVLFASGIEFYLAKTAIDGWMQAPR